MGSSKAGFAALRQPRRQRAATVRRVASGTEMCRQQTVFDRNVVSCHARVIGAKQHPSRRRLAQATSKKTNSPRSVMPRVISDLSRAGAREGIATTRGAIQCQEHFCRDTSRRCSRQLLGRARMPRTGNPWRTSSLALAEACAGGSLTGWRPQSTGANRIRSGMFVRAGATGRPRSIPREPWSQASRLGIEVVLC